MLNRRIPGIRGVHASDVGPLINEHAAAGEGSVHFGLLPVCYRDQHVVLKFLKNLQEKQPYHLYNINANDILRTF